MYLSPACFVWLTFGAQSKKFLPSYEVNIMQTNPPHNHTGVMYLSPACFVWLTFGAAFLEWGAISQAGALSIAAAHWPLFVAAATMGFLINLLAFATIKLASSLTLKVRLWLRS